MVSPSWEIARQFPVFFTENGVARMFQSSAGGGDNTASNFRLPSYQPEKLCHILLGDYAAVTDAINRMAALHYCDRTAWISPIPTGRGGEYISLMTRRLI